MKTFSIKDWRITFFSDRVLVVKKAEYGPPKFVEQYEFLSFWGLRHKFRVWKFNRYGRKRDLLGNL